MTLYTILKMGDRHYLDCPPEPPTALLNPAITSLGKESIDAVMAAV